MKKEEILNFMNKNGGIILVLLLIFVASLGFHIRAQNVPNFQDKYLIALDPYPFYRYAEDVARDSYVRPLDTMRYHPVGYVPMKELLFHSYFCVLLFQFLKTFGFTLMQTFIWFPAITAFLGIIAFYFFVKELFNDKKIALISSAILATIPGFLFRTMVGYSDKEPMAFLLFPVALFFLTKAFKEKETNKARLWALLSGIATGGTFLCWRGIVYITATIAALILLMNILDRVNRKHLELFTLFAIFIPISILGSTSYTIQNVLRGNAFQVFLIAYGLFLITFLLKTKVKSLEKYRPKKIPVGLFYISVSLVILLVFVLIVDYQLVYGSINSYIRSLTTPMGTSRLATSVSENQMPFFNSWWGSLNFILLISILGFYYLTCDILKELKTKKVFGSALLLLVVILLLSNYSPSQNTQLNWLSNNYLIFVGVFLIWSIYYYFKNWEKIEKLELDYLMIFLLVWSFISVVTGRSAIRLIWQAIMPLSILGSYTLVQVSNEIKGYLEKRKIKSTFVAFTPYIIAVILIAFFANNSYGHVYGPVQEIMWDQTTPWIEANTEEDSVFTHWWDYGYWVQGIWGRGTIFDGGNAMHRWNEINARFIMTGVNETQWMNALNYYHRPDYMLIIDDDIMKFYQMARIGMRDYAEGRSIYYSLYGANDKMRNQLTNSTRYPDMLVMYGTPGVITKDLEFEGVLWPKDYTFLAQVILPVSDTEIDEPQGVIVNSRLNTHKVLPFNCVCLPKDGCYDIRTNGVPGCYMYLPGISYVNIQSPPGVLFIPEMAKNMLFTRLYIVNEKVPNFELVYDNGVPLSVLAIQHGGLTNMRIWKINYDNFTYIVDPCEISTNCGEVDRLREILG